MNDLINLFNQAISCHQSGRVSEAINLYMRILPMQRDNEELLFTIGTAYCQIGQLEEGLNYLRKSSRINPKNFHAFGNMGRLLTDLRRFDEAIINYKKALVLNPKFPEALLGLANAQVEINKHKEALENYNKALELVPDFAIAYLNKGKALFELHEFDEALNCYNQANFLAPNLAEVYSNRGNVLKVLEQHEQALLDYNKAIQVNPGLEGAYTNRGCVLEELGRYEEALVDHDKAIALKPYYAEAYSNRGNVLHKLNRNAEALACYENSILLKPDYAEAYSNRGNVLKELARYDEALASYDKAIALKPDIAFLAGSKLHAQMHLCEWNDFDGQLTALVNKIESNGKAATVFPLLALVDAPEIHKQASEIYASDERSQKNQILKFLNSEDNSKIKVGYFSADFHDHATMHLMAELFENHDRDCFEFVAFSFGPITNDEWQKRAKNSFSSWVDCHEKSDREIVQLSRSMGIDIAVDLKGYTQHARAGVFAERAAPIQVNFLGYPGTMGSKNIDYMVADRVLVPAGCESFYTEKIAYLPHCYQPNCRDREISSTFIARSDFGLPEHGFVFSSFNNNYKITPLIFASWMRILKAVDGSVLWLLASNPTAENNLRREMATSGVDPDRLIFAKRLPIKDHLNRIRLADCMLDTFPYGAHTTCSDALRVGLPVITMAGKSFASRVAASLLTMVNMPDLIAHSFSHYEELAIKLSSNRGELGAIREQILKNVDLSALYDSAQFARNLELIYQEMYRTHMDGSMVDHIYAV